MDEYFKTSKTFPHKSTKDQFFSEYAFESYRMLGDFKYLEFSCHDTYEGDNNGDSVKELAPSRGEQ